MQNSTDRIKGLVWEDEGFLLYKRVYSEASTGLVQRKRHRRSHWSNTKHGCRDWKLCPDIPSRGLSPNIFCEGLCKTEKIKFSPSAIPMKDKRVIHNHFLYQSFNERVHTYRQLHGG